MFDEKFEAALMQAVVRQFFENPPITAYSADGQQVFTVPYRTTPVQELAARLLVDKNEALLKAIIEALDLDLLAEKVSALVIRDLTGPTTGFGSDAYRNEAKQKAMRERVDARLVELLAQDLHAKMKADAAEADAT